MLRITITETATEQSWTLEGRLRERFPSDGQLLDYLWFGILDREFARRPEFEPAA